MSNKSSSMYGEELLWIIESQSMQVSSRWVQIHVECAHSTCVLPGGSTPFVRLRTQSSTKEENMSDERIGPKVTLQVVCDGCTKLVSEIKTSYPPYYTSSCGAVMRRTLMPMSREPHVNIPTPGWCPYKAEAIKEVTG